MEKLSFGDIKELENFLDSNGIDKNAYGTGRAKTIKNLFDELKLGEAKLLISKTGKKVIREVKVLTLNVLYKDLKLKESKQVFKVDGIETDRKRERKLETSMGEKINDGENNREAVVRAIKEELGIVLSQEQIDKISFLEEQKTNESESFPGITTRYSLLITDILFNEEQYNPEGYIEKQEDKNTYFEWIKEKANQFD